MTRETVSASRTGLARLGFVEPSLALENIEELAALTGISSTELLEPASLAADPDEALSAMLHVARRDAGEAKHVLAQPEPRTTLWRLLGASSGLGEFVYRHPEELREIAAVVKRLPTSAELRDEMLDAVGAIDGFASSGDDGTWCALRVRYRRLLARIASFDLAQIDPVEGLPAVAAALADAAGAALEASLAVARSRISGNGGQRMFSKEEIARTQLAIIGMGKTGAQELNYVSDVDVIFVGGTSDEEALSLPRAIDVATRLAVQTMRGISGTEAEPPLWEVDANLRPEGKQGALVRSLDSHLNYYHRWAGSWEFQALLKARAIAGDQELGEAYVAAVQPLVWSSAARDNFVDSAQRMRERVTDNIPADEVDQQLKLGPGGLRDIEFTVQLLQLVHGRGDDSIHQRGTLAALQALVDSGYIGRRDAAAFSRDYGLLRLWEHRLQLRNLRRTHLMPTDEAGLRFVARASGIGERGESVYQQWQDVKREVRDIHVRLFYRPLLSAVAALPEDERILSTDQAGERLAAIGFADPKSALRHIRALTSGISRKASIQRHLMPVMLRWFSDGVDPDAGLLAFRRISDRLGDTPWFLRMLRDSSAAAQHLTQVLSSSKYTGELMEWIPESVAWLDGSEHLRPRTAVALQEEARAISQRRLSAEEAMSAVRAIRRREMLRTAMGALITDTTVENLARTLTSITEVTIQATLRIVRREVVPEEAATLDFSVIGMGRFGGSELGFGSDADVMYVFDKQDTDSQLAQDVSLKMVGELRRLTDDPRLPLDLDAGLRPEGRNGPLARSLDAYREYYARWAQPWEAQALIRARGVGGSIKLLRGFSELIDTIRYPEGGIDQQACREIKRIKARVENERLPQGQDRTRHLKLGPGSLSDVEWLVQLLQLQHGYRLPGLRTTSTLDALAAAVEDGLVPKLAEEHLRAAWLLASRVRSANTLLTGKTSDILPTDRKLLDGIGRLLGYPDRSATQVEEDYLSATRRSRRAFEKLFYG